ncbi:proton-coupled zinc antiporter SLC30A2 isoform X2 [Dendropsophus ebraccatus]|uniref:proton-coupled zinc antiporter SLC30A2 isoform X2 n=1 Tax=Dendropsophus ebraccatus TaxID=150705 RepID=UPI003832192B
MDSEEKLQLLKGEKRSYSGVLGKDFHNQVFTYVSDLNAVELGHQGNNHCHSNRAQDGWHNTEKERARRKLYVASCVCLLFMIGEVVEILGALLSVLSIWVVTGVLVYLAVERIISGNYEIEGEAMLITSGCAVAVNIIMGVILHQTGHGHSHGAGDTHGHSHSNGAGDNHSQSNPSVRAAFIHVVGDLLQSLGVLVAAFVIYFKPEYKIIDPICTFLFSVLVLGTTLTILRDVLLVLMEGTPKGVDFNMVKDTLLSINGVKALHSLHIWALTVSQPVLSVHIAINEDADSQMVLKEASARLQSKFHFHTTTIQIENYSEDMRDCQECQDPTD